MGLNWKSFVANKLQLINLPTDVVTFLESGKVSYTKAIRIARVKDEDIREELLKRVVAEELTVKQLQSLITTVSSKTNSSEEIILRDRARAVLKRATSPKLLKDKKIRKKVESLTNQLESLISECE